MVIDHRQPRLYSPLTHRSDLRRPALALLLGALVASTALPALAQDAMHTLVVAGPQTPESLDQEYPPTPAVMEVRRNINEPLLRFAPQVGKDGITYENFDKIIGGLADKWEVSPDMKSITFHLRKGVKSGAGNTLTVDDVMWTFQRGWALKANFYWYMSQVLNISSFDDAFKKIDDDTVQVNVPYSSPLLEKIWTNIGLGILDAQEIKKHVTTDDPWGSKWLASHSASYGPYTVTSYVPDQEVDFQSNPDYYLGAPKLTKVIFKEIPTSSNRAAALEAGAVDVAEFLTPRELSVVGKDPGIKVWEVYGNYIHRIEMNMTMPPFDKLDVRQALNYLTPRDDILKAVYFGT
ncbi:MAG TPA: ABC transporter substrate-binding protein, partial [Pirellulales bacterium]|nr:ABC transporter substrate-binding protein [Pirellulales bacterium]